MKKQESKLKKENNVKTENPTKAVLAGNPARSDEKVQRPKGSKNPSRKSTDKKRDGEGSVFRYVSMSGQFLREAKVELKKVKWPTRKELFASTAVVIFLVILISFYLGVVDFGLIKIIKAIVG